MESKKYVQADTVIPSQIIVETDPAKCEEIIRTALERTKLISEEIKKRNGI